MSAESCNVLSGENPEKQVAAVPNNQQLENRDLATIGIGNVFLVAPSSMERALTQTSDTSNKHNFFSREIVATIKAQPEDFCVQEIALPNRSIPGRTIEDSRVACISNSLGGDIAQDALDAGPVARDFSVLDDRLLKSKRRKVEIQKETPTSGQPGDSRTAQSPLVETLQPTDSLDPREEQSKRLADPRLKALEVLRSALRKSLATARDDTRSANDILDSISNLQKQFVLAIQRQSSDVNDEAKDAAAASTVVNVAKSVGVVGVPPLTSTLSKERGEFHRAVRFAFPMLQSDSVVSEPLPGEGEATKESCPSSHSVRISADPLFLDLAPFLFEPHVDLPLLYEFYRCRFGHEVGEGNGAVVLRLRPGMERKERGSVHRLVAKKSRDSLVTSTLSQLPPHPANHSSLSSDAAKSSQSTTLTGITVSWSRNAKRAAARKRSRLEGSSEPVDPHPNVLFVVRKHQKDHSTALSMLVSAFRCPRSDVTFAGKKDLQAITQQFCTIRSQTPQQVAQAAQRIRKKSNGLELGTAVKVAWLLQVGDLAGNRFEIVLRNARRIKVAADGAEQALTCEEQHVSDCVERIRQHGFINFFGEQRVGMAGDPSVVGVRPFEIGRALLQGKLDEAIDLIMAGRELCGDKDPEHEDIRKARRSWLEQGRNAGVTSKLLPKSSYVSKERLLLNGLKRFSGDAQSALQCIPQEEHSFWVSTYQSYLWNLAATERIRLYGSQCAVVGDLVLPPSADSPFVLDERRAKEQITKDIRNVVLPLVGTNTLFPTNKVGDLFKTVLDGDGINLARQSAEARRGSYRYLVAPTSNLHHKIDRQQNGDVKDIRLQFDLPAGSFATMMLRELMSTTVLRPKQEVS